MSKHKDEPNIGKGKDDLTGKGVAVGEPHPPTAPKDGETGTEPEAGTLPVEPCDTSAADKTAEEGTPEIEAFCDPTVADHRTIAEQLAAIGGAPAEEASDEE